jgi:hypothetical protein
VSMNFALVEGFLGKTLVKNASFLLVSVAISYVNLHV